MQLSRVRIQNFKAIADTSMDLGEFNILVGGNGSGKSSVLQAMHWMFQSGRNPRVEPRRAGGVTLPERQALYVPSLGYRHAAHNGEYGNKRDKPQLDMTVDAQMEDGCAETANMWIKAARNDGLSVHVPSNSRIVAQMRSSREFSAYIPGLSGIPLSEEKRSLRIVLRNAAAGDANMVLRNILLLLKDSKKLERVEQLLSEVMGPVSLNVDFVDRSDTAIRARFKTDSMVAPRAIEYIGIGYLQVMQIFAYLAYFEPVVLLVDEPDAHLHPPMQEKLIRALAIAAKESRTQVVISTRSPSIVRAAPAGARVIWMKGGAVVPGNAAQVRNLMGWGLLDRQILLLTEDSKPEMLQALLAQWPELERKVAVWPMAGSNTLLTADIGAALLKVVGGNLKIALHRDRDFLMPPEINHLQQPYADAGQKLWVTLCSDIEAYWAERDVIAAHFKIAPDTAQALLVEAQESACGDGADLDIRRRKRDEAARKFGRHIGLQQFNDAEVEGEATRHGAQHKILGKTLVAKINELARAQGLGNEGKLSLRVPPQLHREMAPDLRAALESLLPHRMVANAAR